jgi:GNAT superfamily N-acetyltransferase
VLGRDLTVAGTEIKVVGDTASLRSVLPDEWSMDEPCDLMTVAFIPGVIAVRTPYVADVVEDGTTLVGSIRAGDGEVVSSARLAPSGRYGVFDQVGTHPTHRRRGLGTALMRLLGDRALAASLTTGLLSATADGRALYSALGWAVVCELAGGYRG